MTLRAPKSVVPGITDVLLALDAAAGVHKARGVIVMDEFQQISGLTYGKSDTTLEGAIRHAVERAQNISYVFSGSQRHLLETMFVKDDRPLLRHCIKMSLSRIDEDHYRRFLDRASKAQWSKTLDDDVTEKILALTLRHPYYVNALCSRLWDAETPPGVKNVSATWSTIVEEDASMVSYMVRDLSATQRAMLIGIALAGAVEHPLARTFLESVRLSASTGSNAKDVLEADDLIRYSENNEWELVDPVMAEYLRSIST